MDITKAIVLVVSLMIGSTALAQKPPSTEEIVVLRTRLVGQNVVGVTADGRFYAIACKHRFLGFSKSALFLFPNKDGDLTVDDFESKRGLHDKSSYAKLDETATKHICNDPNSHYAFRIKFDGYFDHVEFVGGSTLDADAGGRNRGF